MTLYMELNCIIVDDEPLALDLLEEYVRRTPYLRLAARCTGGQQALQTIESGTIDLAFLDIQMPGINGLELSRRIGGSGTKVIFTTAFEQYAIEGFRVDALDYLLKPFNFTEFSRAAEKAKTWFEMKRSSVAAAPTRQQRNSIMVKADYKQHVIPVSEIIYIESLRDYINIVTENGAVKTLMSMKNIEELLPEKGFARTHRSYIVNIDKVRTVERMQAIVAGRTVPVSESYKESLLAKLASRSA